MGRWLQKPTTAFNWYIQLNYLVKMTFTLALAYLWG